MAGEICCCRASVLLLPELSTLAHIHPNILSILSSMTPPPSSPFPNGAPQSSLVVLAYMLTGEREIPTQDDLFSSKFSPAPSPHFTVNGQCLSVNSSLHHSHSTGQLVSKKTPLIKQYKHTQTHLSNHCPLCTSC